MPRAPLGYLRRPSSRQLRGGKTRPGVRRRRECARNTSLLARRIGGAELGGITVCAVTRFGRKSLRNQWRSASLTSSAVAAAPNRPATTANAPPNPRPAIAARGGRDPDRAGPVGRRAPRSASTRVFQPVSRAARRRSSAATGVPHRCGRRAVLDRAPQRSDGGSRQLGFAQLGSADLCGGLAAGSGARLNTRAPSAASNAGCGPRAWKLVCAAGPSASFGPRASFWITRFSGRARRTAGS